MKPITTLIAVLVMFGMTGCTDRNHYPISGHECGPHDPVKDLNASDCLPPV
jgi:hypothetical protein